MRGVRRALPVAARSRGRREGCALGHGQTTHSPGCCVGLAAPSHQGRSLHFDASGRAAVCPARSAFSRTSGSSSLVTKVVSSLLVPLMSNTGFASVRGRRHVRHVALVKKLRHLQSGLMHSHSGRYTLFSYIAFCFLLSSCSRLYTSRWGPVRLRSRDDPRCLPLCRPLLPVYAGYTCCASPAG